MTHLEPRDISILSQVVYKALREQGDVLPVPIGDREVGLIRDETMKLVKAIIMAQQKYEQFKNQT